MASAEQQRRHDAAYWQKLKTDPERLNRRRARASAYERARHAKNPGLYAREKRRERAAERSREMQSRVLVVRAERAKRARARARKAGRTFAIGGLELPIPDRCPLAGIPLDYRDLHHTPTVDRIDNSRGYELGNVWVISWRANAMKREADLETARRRVALAANDNQDA